MTPTATLAAKLRTARAQPWPVLLLLAPTWALIGAATLAIRLIPMPRLMPRLGRNLGPVALVPLATPIQQRRARHIAAAVGIAAGYAPFRSDCLPQAIVAHLLCRAARIPYALHFGATPAEAGLKAHAWVESGPVTVSGGSGSVRRYATLACYVSASLEGPGLSPAASSA